MSDLEGMKLKVMRLNKHGTREKIPTDSSTPTMDDWGFIEFSEISAAGMTQFLWESEFPTVLVARQNESESCSSLTDESSVSSPTPNQNIGVSEQYSPQTPDANVVKLLRKNQSQLMYRSAASPVTSASNYNIDESFIPSSEDLDPIVWNPTSLTSTSSKDYMAGNFVELKYVNHSRSNSDSFPGSPGKGKGETPAAVVRFLERKSTSFPTYTEREKAQSPLSDMNGFMQSSTHFTTLPKASTVSEHPNGVSEVNHLMKQGQVLVPVPSPDPRSTVRHYAQLAEDKSVMQQPAPFFPSSKGKGQLSFEKYSCHISNEACKRSSDEKQVMGKDQTPYHTARLGEGFSLTKCDAIGEDVMKLRDDFPATTTKAGPEISVKCKSRSKPGCSTNPRSLTEKTRRKRINEKLKELQEVLPVSVKGENIVDMLDQAITYVGNLERQLQVLVMRKRNQRGFEPN